MTEPIDNYATGESIDWEASWALMKERAEDAERRLAAVEAVVNPEWLRGQVLPDYLADSDVHRLRRQIRAALHPVAETTESEAN